MLLGLLVGVVGLRFAVWCLIKLLWIFICAVGQGLCVLVLSGGLLAVLVVVAVVRIWMSDVGGAVV